MAFTAFDDAQTPRRFTRATASGSSFIYDHLRQGVEMNNTKFLYNGVQPKLWAGSANFIEGSNMTYELDHSVKITTYGQALGFTEHDGHQIFEDVINFNPIEYVRSGSQYPQPIVINDSDLQDDECFIEPFVMSNRKNTTENSSYFFKAVHAELEDGNNFYTLKRSSSRISQFYSFQSSSNSIPFSDMHQKYLGNIKIDNYSYGNEKINYSFDDTQHDYIVSTINTNDQTLISKLNEININIDNNLLQHKTKSANAGFIFADSSFGTDSIAFGGTTRGI